MRPVRPIDDRDTGMKRPLPSVLRILLRLPLFIYAHDLGWIMGGRFLQLTHTGRSSGRRHTTVLEVTGHTPTGELLVLSALGLQADWLRNLQAGGPALVTIGRCTTAITHRRLPTDEATAALADYERRNRLLAPVVRRALSMLLGWRYRGSAENRRRAVTQMPLVALRPTCPPPLAADRPGRVRRRCGGRC